MEKTKIDDIKADICDLYCKYTEQFIPQEVLDRICADCPLNKLVEINKWGYNPYQE